MIPQTIQDVDAAWLGDVLGARLSQFAVTQIGQGVGIMGDIYRVHVTYAEERGDQPESVVVKLPSSFEENRSQGVALGMFEAEVRFYNELAPAVAAGLPRIYRADVEAGTANFVIVMEDLSDLVLVEQSIGMSPQQAEAAVRAIAGVHAVWWGSAKQADLEWIPSMVSERITFLDQLLLEILPVFKDGFAELLPPGGVELYEAVAGNSMKINQRLAGRSPWTVVHQDCRVENMLFGDEQHVALLDWQGIGRGPGAYDLAYLLGGSLDVELRRAHEEALVRSYHQRLQEFGVEDYAWAELWDDYGHAQMMGGLATSMLTGGGMDLGNERGRQLIATMASRHATAALDHGAVSYTHLRAHETKTRISDSLVGV